MKYNVYELGNRKQGETVQITLKGSAANVKLMDSSNYQKYKNRRNHKYYGGLAKKSPVILPIPRSGRWYVTVDMQGLRGSVSTSVRMLPTTLPEIKQPALSTVPSLVRDIGTSIGYGKKTYDVFISHASEDKNEVVRPLALALQAKGLSVWYDEFQLKIGDSLRRSIDMALSNSRFGIVVLSKDFIRKGWTNYELDGIITKAVTGEQVMLPIWHNITKNEIMDFSPSLADKLARNTSSFTVQEIAEEIAEVIQQKTANFI